MSRNKTVTTYLLREFTVEEYINSVRLKNINLIYNLTPQSDLKWEFAVFVTIKYLKISEEYYMVFPNKI